MRAQKGKWVTHPSSPPNKQPNNTDPLFVCPFVAPNNNNNSLLRLCVSLLLCFALLLFSFTLIVPFGKKSKRGARREARMSNATSYEPSSLVRSFHKAPHYDAHFSPISHTFAPGDAPYQEALAQIAWPLIVVGILFILWSVVYVCV